MSRQNTFDARGLAWIENFDSEVDSTVADTALVATLLACCWEVYKAVYDLVDNGSVILFEHIHSNVGPFTIDGPWTHQKSL